ncbi:MAG: long-chain fatty acid--CoA ligase, partial [Actinobacteria bacterium]|nr:long-chain fatty acid--CoA ligase [Actinomycetota bacterium]
MLTIPQVVRAAAEFGDREALVVDDRRWSWNDFVDEVHRVAKSFIALGLKPHDRVAVWAPNSAEWMFVALGAQCVGGVLVPINTRFKGNEAAYVIERSGAEFLFVSNGFLGIDYISDVGEHLTPTLRHVVDIAGPTWTKFLNAGVDVPNSVLHERETAVQPDHLSDIIFTSGTTGRPKG